MRKFLCFTLMLAMIAGVFSACSSKPYDYDLENYLSLPDWHKLTVSESETESRLKKNIEELLESKATEKEITERAAAAFDKINISFQCYFASEYGKEGAVPIEKLSDPDCTLILMDMKYPIEFQVNIAGHYVNEKFSVRTTIAGNYGLSEYAAKHVVYDITLNSITEITVPELTDDFVKSVTEYSTVEDFKAAEREKARRELLLEKISELSKVKSYPEDELAAYERNYISYYTTAATNAGCTLEQYVNRKFFMTLSAFHLESAAYAKEMVKKDLILYQFVRTYKLDPTDEEYRIGAEKYVQMYGLKSISALEAKFGEEFIRKSIAYDKVLHYIGTAIPATPEKSEASSN